MPPKVSVLTPCYGNRTAYLSQRIDSILNQTYQDFEWILVDDGCVEASRAVLKELEQHPRVKAVIHHPHSLGVSRSYNEALALAEGEFILRAEDDDYCEPSLIERQVAVLERNPNVGLVFTAGVAVDAQGGFINYSWDRMPEAYRSLLRQDWIRPGHQVFKDVLVHNIVHGYSQMFRRQCYQELGPYCTDLERATDRDFVLRIALRYDVAYLAEPLVCYRQHQDNLTRQQSRTATHITEDYVVLKRAFSMAEGQVLLSPALKRRAWATVNLQAVAKVIHFVAHGRVKDGASVLLAAFSQEPAVVLYLWPGLMRKLRAHSRKIVSVSQAGRTQRCE